MEKISSGKIAGGFQIAAYAVKLHQILPDKKLLILKRRTDYHRILNGEYIVVIGGFGEKRIIRRKHDFRDCPVYRQLRQKQEG